MSTEIRVPTLGESVSEATVGKWFKKPGDFVKADEPLVELETDKVTLEVNAPATGTLSEILALMAQRSASPPCSARLLPVALRLLLLRCGCCSCGPGLLPPRLRLLPPPLRPMARLSPALRLRPASIPALLLAPAGWPRDQG